MGYRFCPFTRPSSVNALKGTCGPHLKSRYSFLRGRHFFNDDAGHRVPALVGICIAKVLAVANMEAHLGRTSWDVAVAFNCPGSQEVFVSRANQVHGSINGQWGTTFSIVECEVPALAAVGAAAQSQVTAVAHMQVCVSLTLVEVTSLQMPQHHIAQKIHVFL